MSKLIRLIAVTASMCLVVAATLVTGQPAIAGPVPAGWALWDHNRGGGVSHEFSWGAMPDDCRPLVGDWNGDGVDSAGAVCPVGQEWSWLMQNQFANNATDYWFNWGSSGCIPMVGDWDGNSTDTPGIACQVNGQYRWTLWNHNAGGGASAVFNWGGTDSCWAISGDWNGDRVDTPGLVCPRGAEWEWIQSNRNAAGGESARFRWGGSSCAPKWGDWNNDGSDTPAVACKLASGEYDWSQSNHNAGGGVANHFRWGGAPHVPLVGDWNADGIDTVGVTDLNTAPPPPPSSSGYACPVDGAVSFTDTWGAPRSGGRTHKGTDMFATRGTPLVAVLDATVTYVQNTDSGLSGRYVKIRADDGNSYLYIHNDRNVVRVGQRVTRGQVLGYVGNTGNAATTPPHVHFEAHHLGTTPFNPYPYVHAWCPGHG